MSQVGKRRVRDPITPIRFRPNERKLLESLAEKNGRTMTDTVRDALRLLAEREGGSNVLPVGKGESVRQVWKASAHALK